MYAAAKVVTITLNTALDRVIWLDGVPLGTTMRAMRSVVFPAGKGICVAVGVATLGFSVVATGFVGKDSERAFESLRREGVFPSFISVPGETRTNITLLERESLRETHIQTTGYSVTGSDVVGLSQAVRDMLCEGDVLVISGSVPEGVPVTVMKECVQLGKTFGATVILDTNGDSLQSAVKAKPYMVKPNMTELATLVGVDIDASEAELVEATRDVARRGPELVVTSRGAWGIIVAERDGRSVWRAHLESTRRPRETTAAVGSGDALVSAFAVSKLKGRPLEEAMRLAVACGAANVLTRAPGRFSLSAARRLQPDVQIYQIA